MLEQSMVNKLNRVFKPELKACHQHQKSNAWNCPIDEVTLEEYLIIPLISARKVKSEGYLMQNCCRDYIPSCVKGKYLLFSIRDLFDRRIATLGARKNGERWVFDQCLGEQNTVVMEQSFDFIGNDGEYISEFTYTEIFSVAHEVIRLLNANLKAKL